MKTNAIYGALFVFICFASFQAQASEISAETQNNSSVLQADVSAKKAGLWRANIRRLGLELSSVEVSNAKEYQDSPVSALNADSQTLVKGIFDFVLEYETDISRWDNSVFLNYGKTKIKPYNEPTETTENADEILLTSDYTYKMYRFKNLDLGPFASVAYQTEFTRNEDAPRMKVIRAKSGAKLLNGALIKELYVAGVGEYDFTYAQSVTKLAGELGWRFEKTPREGIQISTDGYFRKYFMFSHYIGTDLKYDLNLTARMDVNITDTLTFGPYISYRLAKARAATKYGSNFTIGLSLAYKNLFNL